MKSKSLMTMAANFFYKISPRLGFSLQYLHHRKRFPNLKNPHDLSEIIGSQMVSGIVNEFSHYVDKIKVRESIAEWGLEDYLPRIYRVWDHADDICLDELPDRFILKTNHGSGGHMIYDKSSPLDLIDVKNHFRKRLEQRYNAAIETQYNAIKPQVYAEEFIDDGNPIPTDYKFLCLDGEIKAILVCFDRDKEVHKIVYDTNWKKLPYIKGDSFIDCDYPIPTNFETMKAIVRIIASRFIQVRVDLYNAFGKIYIGELTFTADGGILRNFTSTAIKEMGRE